MAINYKFIHKQFKLNGVHYQHEDLVCFAKHLVDDTNDYQQTIGGFLLDWLYEGDFVKVNTSGSTGIPKTIQINKQAMVNSAIATGQFFNLKPGNTALHCLPSKFIAGKMMLVRAMILGLEIDLVEPTSKPVFDVEKVYQFCAMIPLQVENSLDNCNNIETIIVGGASVSRALKAKIQKLNSNVFETYGMTETVTHIALKKLNNPLSLRGDSTKQSFRILPGISIYKDERNCLIINAPKLSQEEIVTNDMVNIISETEFEWLGRFDNIINSGGLKLFPEQIEAKLHNKIQGRFFITGIPHDTLGEQLVLIIEGTKNTLDSSVFTELNKYEKPKQVYSVKQFIETPSGKIQRIKTLELIKDS